MNPILGIALLLIGGFLGGKALNRLKLPAVTGYLLVGLLLGSSVLNLVDTKTLETLEPINNIALGLIAFIIGGEFSFENLRKLGRSVMLIAILEVAGAFTFVAAVMVLVFRLPLSTALIFGAISSATAPAATVLVLRELKAKGPLTDTLLAVVAIDDALCVIAFGLATTAAKALSSGVLAAATLWRPIIELGGSVVLGGLLGLVLAFTARRLRNHTDLLVVALGLVFLSGGASSWLHLSPLLTTMTLGCTLVNLSREQSNKAFAAIKTMDTPIYVAFFAMAGASLHLAYLWNVGLIGVGYILARVAGKAAGASLGATLGQSPASVRKYLGLGLVPQAGVAIGVTMLARQEFPALAQMLTTVILGSVVIYEIIGPVCAKIAILRSGEAHEGSSATAAASPAAAPGR